MKDAVNQFGPFDKKKECLNVIVETPKGSRVKYAYESDVGLFQVKKALPEGMTFPFNFGFIPGTAAEDGDPLDILILNEESLVPGCLLKVTVAGVIKAKQTEDGKSVRNDRLFGFALRKETPSSLESMGINQKTLEEIEYFFKSYNKLEGKKFKILGQSGRSKALAIIKKRRQGVCERKRRLHRGMTGHELPPFNPNQRCKRSNNALACGTLNRADCPWIKTFSGVPGTHCPSGETFVPAKVNWSMLLMEGASNRNASGPP